MNEENLREAFKIARQYCEVGQSLFLDLGATDWYANIRHQKGYTVWYHHGVTPIEALLNLADALEKRGTPKNYTLEGKVIGA